MGYCDLLVEEMAESMKMAIDLKEPIREGSEDSMDSTPEAETEIPQDNAGLQKRKGGRKPVC